MLFIALPKWILQGKSHVLTIEEKNIVTQCIAAVILDIQTQEDLSPKHWDEIRDQSVFQTKELGMDRRCDCQIALGKECNKCKLYKE